jgi:hypothetical protein
LHSGASVAVCVSAAMAVGHRGPHFKSIRRGKVSLSSTSLGRTLKRQGETKRKGII